MGNPQINPEGQAGVAEALTVYQSAGSKAAFGRGEAGGGGMGGGEKLAMNEYSYSEGVSSSRVYSLGVPEYRPGHDPNNHLWWYPGTTPVPRVCIHIQ